MRYLGNKTKLLNEIEQLLKDKGVYKEGLVFCDAFSGTGTVGEYFKNKYKIIANDSLYMSYVIAHSKLNIDQGMFQKLGFDPFTYFNELNEYIDTGFIYNNYCPEKGNRQYFSNENGKIIDTIRNQIDLWFNEGKINNNEKLFLIASLIESVSFVANVAGVYGAFLKIWDKRALKKMLYRPITEDLNNSTAAVYNQNVIDLLNIVEGDILYLDPPYTAIQYSSQYHLLETIAKNDNPVIKGITGIRDMSHISSDFSKKTQVHIAFEKLIEKAKFKHIILSYSPDGLMSEEFIKSVLNRYGKEYELRKVSFNKYKNSKTDNTKNEHQEFLFYIQKKDFKEVNVSSPLNYQGGKHDLIDFIKENLPKNIETFYDLFGGGLNVGINTECFKVVYNDINFKVKELIECIVNADKNELLSYLTSTINRYGLSVNNKEAFLKLRNKYNKSKNKDFKDLYLLCVYGFQQQMRFNNNHEFNNPVGVSYFNEYMIEKLLSFKSRSESKDIEFYSKQFEYFKSDIQENDIIYCDPPYLITLGSYNDGKRGFHGWNENDEKRLLDFLSDINQQGKRFMLSNVITHKDKTNYILKEWIESNNFKVIEYTGKARGKRKEVIIMNY